MRTRFSRLLPQVAAALCALTLAGSARADHIYKWTDEDGVLHISNIRKDARHHRGSSGSNGSGAKLKADPSFTNLMPGPAAPLDFVPSNASARYDEAIREACTTYHIPPALVRAIMNAESNFDPRAMSDKGAIGLMQLMPGTADTMYVSDIHNPRENILGGVRYLRVLANTFDGDMVKIVAAYNAGPKAVIAAGGVPQIPETQDYVRKVLRLYFKYKAEAGTAVVETASAH